MSDAQPAANYTGPAMTPGVGQEDPGKTLGLVGLILAFVANVIGLIVSIVAFRKSKKAGFNNGLAKGGIIVGIITTLGALIVTGVLIASSLALLSACGDLGPGVHQVGGTTVTCG
jgi:hypothetical protein